MTPCASTHGTAGYAPGSYRLAGYDVVVCGVCHCVVPYRRSAGRSLPTKPAEPPSTFTRHRNDDGSEGEVTVGHWPLHQMFAASLVDAVDDTMSSDVGKARIELDGDLLRIRVANGEATYRLSGRGPDGVCWGTRVAGRWVRPLEGGKVPLGGGPYGPLGLHRAPKQIF